MAVSFSVLLLLRLFLALSVVTRFHADEYWQSQEPAYNIFYPEGGGRWTYEWVFGLRSYFSIFPFLMVVGFTKFVGNFSATAEEWLLMNARKIAAAVIAAATDYFMLKCTTRYFGAARSTYTWFILFSVCDCEISDTLNRSYTNGIESMFSMLALYLWPVKWAQTQYLRALACAGLAVLTRSSSAVTWIIPSMLAYCAAPNKANFLGLSLLIVSLILGLGLVVDRIGHGSWVSTVWNFVYWNLLTNLATFHGTSSFITYLYTMCFFSIHYMAPMLAYGLYQAVQYDRRANLMLFSVALVIIAAFSLLEHKEPRFILMPQIIISMYSAFGAQQTDILLSKRSIFRSLYRLILAFILFGKLLATIYAMRFKSYGFEQAVEAALRLYDTDESIWRPESETPVISIFSHCFMFPGKGLTNRPIHFDITVCPGGEHFTSRMPLTAEETERLFLACEGSPELLLRNYQYKNRTMPSIVIVSTSDIKKSVSGWLSVVGEAGYSLCDVMDIRDHPFLDLVRASDYLKRHTRYHDSHFTQIYLYCRRRDGAISNNFYTHVAYQPGK